VKWADATDPESFRAALSPKTKAVFIESIANPGGIITDIEAIAKIAHSADVPLIVDNTLASPYLIRPFEWGADIILHSATKFLGGHGNSMAGLIVDGGKFDWAAASTPPCRSLPLYHGMKLWETFGDMAYAIACRVLALRDLGPALSPMNAFLILQGNRNAAAAMQRHCDNALAVARWLKANPKVAWVNYAGLEDNPCYALHRKYCPKGAGSVFTFGVKGGYEAGMRLVNSVRLFSHLANIGDTRSLIIHPASTTHANSKRRIAQKPARRRCGALSSDRECGRHHRRSGSGLGRGITHPSRPRVMLRCERSELEARAGSSG